MLSSGRIRLLAYGIAVVGTAISLWIRLSLWPVLGAHTPYMTFLPVVFLSAYFGGLWPGLLATLLAAVAGDFYVLEPRFTWLAKPTYEIAGMGLFLMAGAIISVLSESLHRAWRRILDQQRHRADVALRASEQRWRNLTEALPQLVWTAAPDGACDYFSTQWTQYTGAPEADLLGWRWMDVLHPADREATRRFWTDSVAGLSPYDVEYRVRRLDGAYGWFKTRGVPIRDADGNIIKWFGTCTDITERKQAEDALDRARIELEVKVAERTAELRRASAELQTILDASPIGIALFGKDRTVQRCNPAFERIVGWRADEIIGRQLPVAEHLRRYAAPLIEGLIRREGFANLELRLARKDGSEFDAAVACAPLQDEQARPAGFVITAQDITERKSSDAALRRSEAYLAEAQRLSHSGSLAWVPATGEIIYWSEETYRLLGFDPAAGPPRFETFFQRIHPDDQASVREAVERAIHEKTDYELDYRIVHPGGAVNDIHVLGHPVTSGSGELLKFVGTIVDVTERKRAEAERESLLANERAARGEAVAAQHRFRDLVNSIEGLVWEADAQTFAFSFVNERAERILGYPVQRWLSESTFWSDHLHPADRDAAVEFCQKATAENRNHDFEYRMIAADGRSVWLRDLVTVVVEDGRASKLRGVMIDITQRKQAEGAVREQANLLNLTHDSIFVRDANDVITYWNRGAEHLYGWTSAEAVGAVSHQLTQTLFPASLDEINAELLRTGRWEGALVRKKRDGTQVVVASRWSLERDNVGKIVGILETNNDITERKRAEALLAGEKRLLEMVARGDSLPRILESLCLLVEEQASGVLASVLLMDSNGKQLRHGGAPNLPKAYTDAIDGAVIGPSVGSCGTAAYRAQQVIVSDIATDPLWADFRDVALAHSLRACWSTPILSAEGKVIGTFAMYYREPRSPTSREQDVIEQITHLAGVAIQRKQAEEALRRSEAYLAEAQRLSHTGSFGWDVWSGEIYWSAETFRIFEYDQSIPPTVERVLQRTHPLDRALVREAIDRASRDRTDFELEHRLLMPDGSVKYLQVVAHPSGQHASGSLEFVGMVTDVTERRAKEAAEAANRAKDEFLANVSHEIRTPMNAILGMTELVLDTPLNDDQRQSLKTVKSAADNLLGIINDLLDFSKIEAGKLALDVADFSLRAAVGDTLRALAVRAHKKGLELICRIHPDVPDALIGDASRLRQVLLNLLGNAVKFTSEGEVLVQVEPLAAAAAGQADVGLRFTVCDTGIGIPRAKQEMIFRAFEQEDSSTTRKYGGTGLGLTISARLVALMAGQISVESEPGKGSTFSFTAYFGRQARPPRQPIAQPPVSLHDLPVLIVDDNATNRRILEEWLRGWQMAPAAVGDGLAAMDALWHGTASDRPYPLVLLDARMPDADGLALTAQIRQRSELSATRIILLTSGHRPGDVGRFRELRVDAHLLKPLQQEELLETIYRVMSRGDDGRIPRPAERRQEREPAASAPVRAAAPLRILVAEDNEFNAQLLEQLLAGHGHHVRMATDGRAALTLAEQGQFDLLLLDVHMPELDGFQVAQAIRERERTVGGHLPVIALTARSRREDREHCLASGMDDFLAKPIHAENLWAAIDRVAAAAHPPADRPAAATGLLDARVLLAACGGSAGILEKICQAFQARLPDHLTTVHNALRDRDATGVREAAHKLAGMVAAFSTAAGGLASELEELAARGQIEEARPAAKRLDTLARQLIELTRGLSVQTLQRQAAAAEELNLTPSLKSEGI